MATKTIMAQFIKNELDAYIETQRVHCDPVGINLIIKAFEAYEEYKRLVSYPKALPFCRHGLGWIEHAQCLVCEYPKDYGQDI